MIQATHLTKRYGAKTAVDDATFSVRPGIVTGFLGPNGAGKSTTMRMIVGLDRPTSGGVTINGAPYSALTAPLREVGILLDAKAVHPGRSARGHLRALAATHGIPQRRVDEVIGLTGLDSVAGKRVKGFSLGMGQRLGIAAALLGDPATLILDEPVNGLDPDGVLWLRRLLAGYAARGRTVFLSSHLMSELSLIADDLVVIGQGRLLAAGTVSDVIASVAPASVHVVTPAASALATVLQGADVTVTSLDAETLEVQGRPAHEIGEIASAHRIPLHELSPRRITLEEAFMQITRNAVEYGTPGSAAPRTSAPLESVR